MSSSESSSESEDPVSEWSESSEDEDEKEFSSSSEEALVPETPWFGTNNRQFRYKSKWVYINDDEYIDDDEDEPSQSESLEDVLEHDIQGWRVAKKLFKVHDWSNFERTQWARKFIFDRINSVVQTEGYTNYGSQRSELVKTFKHYSRDICIGRRITGIKCDWCGGSITRKRPLFPYRYGDDTIAYVGQHCDLVVRSLHKLFKVVTNQMLKKEIDVDVGIHCHTKIDRALQKVIDAFEAKQEIEY